MPRHTVNMLPISNATAFDQLKKLVDTEGPHLADPDWMGMLAGLGIVKGEPFGPANAHGASSTALQSPR